MIRIEVGDEEQAKLVALAEKPGAHPLLQAAAPDQLSSAFGMALFEDGLNMLADVIDGDPALTVTIIRWLKVFGVKPATAGVIS